MNKTLNMFYNVFGLICFVAFFARVFFHIPDAWIPTLSYVAQFAMISLVATEFIRFMNCRSVRVLLTERRAELAISTFILLYFIFSNVHLGFLPDAAQDFIVTSLPDITLAYLGLTSLLVVVIALADLVKKMKQLMDIELSTNSLFVLSFLMAIAITTVLLKLPKSTPDGISWIDAFFTAVSAICITGLTTLNIADEFTLVGQTVILIGFQLGGLGIMTMTMLLASLFAGGLAVGEFVMLKKIFDSDNVSEAAGLFRRICLLTFGMEFIGFWLLLNARLADDAILNSSLIYESLFHAVSAFCNAGFTLFSNSLSDAHIAGNQVYIYTIMGLVVLGSLGFPVIISCWRYFTYSRQQTGPKPRLSTHAKIVLTATIGLLLIGGLSVYLLESNQSFAELTNAEKLRQSFFLSVTTRSSGFNLWSTEALSLSTLCVVMLFMWIGGAPISMGGGIKCTTFMMALLQLYNLLRGKTRTEIFQREISQAAMQRAFAVIFGSLIIIFVAFISLINLNPHIDVTAILFECVSAWATTGLSMGATPELSSGSKLIIIFLMFGGRVGFFTFFSLFTKTYKERNFKYLKDHITVY